MPRVKASSTATMTIVPQFVAITDLSTLPSPCLNNKTVCRGPRALLTTATDKSVPSEEITKEAKEAEPDAVEQNNKVGFNSG